MNPDLPPTPAASPSGLYIRLADALVAVGALLILLFSWAPMVTPTISSRDDARFHSSLWSWLSPLGLFVVLAVLMLLATAVLDTFWHREKQLVGLHRHHVQVGLALFVLVDIFGMMLADPFSSLEGLGNLLSVGWGGVMMLLFALIATAGAVLNHFNMLQNPLSLPKSAPAVTYPPAAAPVDPAAGGYAPPTQAAPTEVVDPDQTAH
jgi:hypothetical protein